MICEKRTRGPIVRTSNSTDNFGPLHQIGNRLIQSASAVINNGGYQLLDEIVRVFAWPEDAILWNWPFDPKSVFSVCQPGFIYIYIHIYNTINESRAGDSGTASYM